MASNPIQQKTGDADIVKTGHTASSQHASNPDTKVKGPGNNVRDLGVSANGNS